MSPTKRRAPAKRGRTKSRGRGTSNKGSGIASAALGIIILITLTSAISSGKLHIPGTNTTAPIPLPSISLPPLPHTTPAPATSAYDTARAQLAALPVQPAATHDGYSRDQFGPAWADVDGNSCDTRNDVLHRDLTNVTYKSGSTCVITSGTLNDPYTGKTIKFVRGSSTSSAVQVDHVTALSNAWETGAAGWDATKRQQFANDPNNLIAVDGPTNQAKGDDDASEWLPPNKAFRCEYVARQVAVKTTYGLWATPAEHAAMADVLAGCK